MREFLSFSGKCDTLILHFFGGNLLQTVLLLSTLAPILRQKYECKEIDPFV